MNRCKYHSLTVPFALSHEQPRVKIWPKNVTLPTCTRNPGENVYIGPTIRWLNRTTCRCWRQNSSSCWFQGFIWRFPGYSANRSGILVAGPEVVHSISASRSEITIVVFQLQPGAFFRYCLYSLLIAFSRISQVVHQPVIFVWILNDVFGWTFLTVFARLSNWARKYCPRRISRFCMVSTVVRSGLYERIAAGWEPDCVRENQIH